MPLPKVVITAEVEDVTRWEQSFRTHGELFRSQTVTTPVGIAVQEDNTAACCLEPTDLTAFMKVLLFACFLCSRASQHIR